MSLMKTVIKEFKSSDISSLAGEAKYIVIFEDMWRGCLGLEMRRWRKERVKISRHVD